MICPIKFIAQVFRYYYNNITNYMNTYRNADSKIRKFEILKIRKFENQAEATKKNEDHSMLQYFSAILLMRHLSSSS